MNAPNPLLSVRDLSVTFGQGLQGFQAVQKINFDVYEGEIVGLIGESGSGKTTSAHAFLGLLDGQPGIVDGQVQFLNQDCCPPIRQYVRPKPNGFSKRATAFGRAQKKLLAPILGKGITSIFQEPKSALNPYWTIGAHLIESIRRGGNAKNSELKTGLQALAAVGIPDGANFWNQYPHQLSGGLAQRVMIAMALVANPKLLVADEPTTALDVTTQAKLLQLFSNLRKERGMSILLITHDIGVVREIADRVYVMYRGSIIESGKTSDILKNPQHEYTKKLISAFYRFAEIEVQND